MSINKFDNMKNYVIQNLSYYSDNRVDIKYGMANFDEFPVIDKEVLRLNYKGFVSSNIEEEKIITQYTSGSTGTPLKLFKTTEEMNRLALTLYKQRCRVIPNGFLKLTKIEFYAAIKNDKRYITGKVLRVKNKIYFSTLHMDDESLKEYCDILKNNVEHGWILGCPSIVERMAEFITNNSIKIDCINYIELTGEMCFPHQRQIVEAAFRCPIRNHYGSREFWGIAFECEHGKLHILDDHVYVESINNEIVVSTLDQYTMPLIKYNIGDAGNICEEECQCGQKGKTLELLGGRTSDYIYTVSGKVISPYAIYLAVFQINDKIDNIIKRFQARQININEIQINLVLNYSTDESTICRLYREKLHRFIGSEINISIFIVNDIANEENGKYKYFISDINKSLL